jgi:general secretion pathway protein D
MSVRGLRPLWAAVLLLSWCIAPQLQAQDQPADQPDPTIETLGEPKRPQDAEAGPNEMYIDFEDAPLQDVIRAISQQTGRNFEFDPNTVNQKVTLVAHHPVPKEMAFEILETILAAPPRNLQIVKTLEGNLYRIIQRVPGQGADKMEISSGKGQTLSGFDRFAIHVVKVEYADVTKVGDLLKKVGSEIADITAYPQSGLLILRDSIDGIRNMLSLLEVIDVPGTGTSVEIFALQWTRAETLAEQVSQVLLGESSASGTGQQGGPAIVRRAPRVDPGTGQPVSEVIGQDEQVLRVVPDERLNALIVVASEAMMQQVRTLVDALDTANDPDTNNIHYRPLQNADGEKLSETLEAIIGSSEPAQASNGGGGGGGGQSGAVQAFEREVTVSFYEPTNALLILASPQDYKLIDDIITKLDVPQRQISVEAVIMGVTINENASLGVESAFLNQDDFFALSNTISIANLLTGGTAGAAGAAATGLVSLAGPGGTIGILDGTTEIEVGGETVTVPNVPFLMKALETVTDVDVLSRPNLMIVDNEKASINVGQEIPLIASQGDVDDRTGFNSRSRVDRRETGVTLEVTPQIQEGDFVSMLVLVKVEDPVRSDIGLDPNETGATIARSALDTTVVIGDGKTGIVGGLLRESLAHTINQVPGLGDLPLIGWLFRSKGNSRAKQNLVIMLSPHIIKQGFDVDRVSDLRMQQFRTANIDAIFEKGFVKKIGGKRQQRKTGPVRRGEGVSVNGEFDRGGMRND